MLEDLLSGECVVGTKQVQKALAAGTLQRVYIAEDVDPHIRARLAADCERAGVAVVSVVSMKHLGKACSIEVGAACAGLFKPRD
ncbi:Ribosome-associated protein L7Ae-like protein [bioreactor metagenome]|uniref:Ribosome-associated protein L7Ae-like protein n=1 Tax=bioreactor metagenome TaxID=1076179 RepID=A0A645J0L3_9ZZZZ